MANRSGNNGNSERLYFGGLQNYFANKGPSSQGYGYSNSESVIPDVSIEPLRRLSTEELMLLNCVGKDS